MTPEDEQYLMQYMTMLGAGQGQEAEIANQRQLAELLRQQPDADLSAKDSGRFLSAPPAWAAIGPALSMGLQGYAGAKAAKNEAALSGQRLDATKTMFNDRYGKKPDVMGGAPQMSPSQTLSPLEMMLRQLRQGN